MICYIDVGTAENWRADYSSFPASVLGNSNGWPGEKWLDIRQLSVLEPIITARFAMCKTKGFDAVEPDNVDGYENDSGFPLSARQQLTYDEWVAGEVHPGNGRLSEERRRADTSFPTSTVRSTSSATSTTNAATSSRIWWRASRSSMPSTARPRGRSARPTRQPGSWARAIASNSPGAPSNAAGDGVARRLKSS